MSCSCSSDMNETFGLAKHMESSISASALRSFVEVAKADHLVYKFEIYKVMMGVSNRDPSSFSDHTLCRLGKWYYQGTGRELYSSHPGYSAIEQPHKEVHASGIEALEYFRKGDLHGALDAVAAMEQASMAVLDGLERMAASEE